MSLDRRAFLATLAAGLAAPAILRAAPARKSGTRSPSPPWAARPGAGSTILDQADAARLRGPRAARRGGRDGPDQGAGVVGHAPGRDAEASSPGAASSSPTSGPPRACTRRTRPTRAKQFDEGRALHRPRAGHGREVRAHVRRQGARGRDARRRCCRASIEGFQQMAAHAKPAGRGRADRVARRLHELASDLDGDPDRRRLRCLRSAVGRAPHLRGRARRRRRTPTPALRPLDPAHAPQGFAPAGEPRGAGATCSRARARCRSTGAGRGAGQARAIRATTASSGRRSGTRRSRSRRSPSRTTRRRRCGGSSRCASAAAAQSIARRSAADEGE